MKLHEAAAEQQATMVDVLAELVDAETADNADRASLVYARAPAVNCLLKF